jgi:hypothetical protein
MVNIQRIRIGTTGFPGAPGLTTFYAIDASAALPELKGLCADFCATMPDDVVFDYPVVGDIIDPLDGTLVGEWTAASRAGDTGAQIGVYAAPSGCSVTWETGDIMDGHRLRGRTFFVPLAAAVYQTDGSIDNTVLTSMNVSVGVHQTAMAGNLVIWHRPRAVSTAHPVARAGGYGDVVSGHVADKVAVLRSRRP